MITDAWRNPIVGSHSFVGFSSSAKDFPHSLLSYIQSSIIENDRHDTLLLSRFFYTLQIEWESIYGKILNLPTLYNPDTTPAEVLEYLKYNVGISDNLNYIWGNMREIEKRKFIKYFIRFIQKRSTGVGLYELFETMSGRPIDLFSYFYYQWILSGSEAVEMHTESGLGEYMDENDPWLISEYHHGYGIQPDAIFLIHYSPSISSYRFRIDTLIARFLETETTAIPQMVRIVLKTTRKSILARIYINGGSYYVQTPPNYHFEHGPPYSVNVTDFITGFDVDQYIYDIAIMDDGSLNRPMIEALGEFIRATHERIYIRYYHLIEKFNYKNDEWNLGPLSTINTDDGILILAS